MLFAQLKTNSFGATMRSILSRINGSAVEIHYVTLWKSLWERDDKAFHIIAY